MGPADAFPMDKIIYGSGTIIDRTIIDRSVDQRHVLKRTETRPGESAWWACFLFLPRGGRGRFIFHHPNLRSPVGQLILETARTLGGPLCTHDRPGTCSLMLGGIFGCGVECGPWKRTTKAYKRHPFLHCLRHTPVDTPEPFGDGLPIEPSSSQ